MEKSFQQPFKIVFIPLFMFLGFCFLETLAILYANSGHFLYTLDDPYIHLSLAENIAKGHYGINMSEYAAPSSSPLWPFILAPFTLTPFADYAPLALNILSNMGTIAIFAYISGQVVNSSWGAGVLATFLMLGTNLIGLTFSGMEHSLQVCLAVIVVTGLIVDTQKGQPPWWLLVALILEPLVRYEGLMVTGISIVYLICRGHYKAAGVCTTLSVILLGGFSWFLLSLGLESLPTSVLIKMATHTEVGNWGVAIFKANLNLDTRTGTMLLMSLLLLSPIFADPQRTSAEKFIAGWAILLTIAHLATAPMTGVSLFIHFDRYDMYLISILLLLLLYFYGNAFRQLIHRHNPIWVGFQSMLFLAFIAQPYLMTVLFTPVASNNIFEQQYQLQKFVQQHYRMPVAVNDLGLMSFRNPQYVLDLWGLGSYEAFTARITENPKVWIQRLTKKHQVEAAILYDGWFPIVPDSWIKVATLHLSKLRLSPAESHVSFYAVNHDALPSLTSALNSFQETLPPEVDLRMKNMTILNSKTSPSSTIFSENNQLDMVISSTKHGKTTHTHEQPFLLNSTRYEQRQNRQRG